MSIAFADRVRAVTATSGTGTINLGAAVSGFRTFAAAVTAGHLASGNTVFYCIEDGTSWEVGSGTYTAGAPDTMTRTVYSSSAGGTTALTLSGSAQVFIVISSDAQNVKGVTIVTASGGYTTILSDQSVILNKTVAAATAVTLIASPSAGRLVTIKDGKGDSATNNITISPAAGTIDGSANVVLKANYASVDLVYNGTQWNIL